MLIITQYFIRKFIPVFNGYLTKILYWGRGVKIGKRFKADSVPRILIDKDAKLTIGNDVEFKRNVEIRVHKQSTIHIGNSIRVDRGVRLLSNNNAIISIEDGVRIGLYTVFNGGDSITVGKKSLISGFVYLQTSMHGHATKDLTVQDQGYLHSPVILEEDTWLGTHVVIMPGITIGKGAVVGSNAVVTKNVENYNIVAGIPAKTLKLRS